MIRLGGLVGLLGERIAVGGFGLARCQDGGIGARGGIVTEDA